MKLINENLKFAEGLRWRDNRLWLSDFINRKVYTLEPGGALTSVAYVPGQPSGLGFLPDGRALVVSMMDRKLLRIDEDGLTEIADLAALAVGPCNDMTVDGEGNAYIGSMGYEPWYLMPQQAEDEGRIIRVGVDGSARIAASSLAGPNGMAFIDDGRRLVVAETRACRLTVFDVAADGDLVNRRVFADLDDVSPDGICAAPGGNIWVSGLYSGKFFLVREGGAVLASVPTPGRWAVTCILDDQSRHLYCVTASLDAPDDFRFGRTRSALEYIDLDTVAGAGSQPASGTE